MKDIDKGAYIGEDRRKEQRRKSPDRRDDIRFEPNKDDRRVNRGRRKADGDVWQDHEE
ncbi:hypothetical protein [uncultured Porticoccus sp.]|uniref:hypothetical protein n=1 Tax=uncultured Porticoccus sp. TaxID=1256050 RepID=UPI0030DA5F6E|tara:strand:+ start:4225 stop:4398 length:174 start_codon:yes stop_codon:yes gene_type:complete